MRVYLLAFFFSIYISHGQVTPLDPRTKEYLIKKLDSIFLNDQKYRLELDLHGNDRQKVKELWQTIHFNDSVNRLKVLPIIDKYGWLSPAEVGDQASTTLFLVIQHADKGTQIKYLPIMREAVKLGKASASSLALLEDRVALKQGKKQVYGSQVFSDPRTGESYVFPLLDPDNVDMRRKEVGLESLESYLKNFDMTWDLQKYKADLPEIERMTLAAWDE